MIQIKNIFIILTFCRFTLCRPFDPLSFDPLSFDPVSFDPLSFDPMSVNQPLGCRDKGIKKLEHVISFFIKKNHFF